MSEKRDLRKVLRESATPDLVRDVLRGGAEWILALLSCGDTVELTGYGALVNEFHRNVPPSEAWSGLAVLSNWAPTPFTLDGQTYASVESFYHSLKYPEGSEKRAAIGNLDGPMAQHKAGHRRGKTLQFRGSEIAVDSPEHAAVIAEAVVAKVKQHEAVRDALLGTGNDLLTFPDGTKGRNALGQATPLALMIERARLPGR